MLGTSGGKKGDLDLSRDLFMNADKSKQTLGWERNLAMAFPVELQRKPTSGRVMPIPKFGIDGPSRYPDQRTSPTRGR